MRSGQTKTEEKAEVKAKILVIDDDVMIVSLLKDVLSAEGYEVVTAENGERGVTLAKREHPSLVIVDIMMPGIDGIETIKRIREFNTDVGIVVLTAYGKRKDAVTSAVKFGVFDYIIKPFDIDYLLSIVKYAVSRSQFNKLPYLSEMKDYYWGVNKISEKEFLRKKWKDLKVHAEHSAELIEEDKKFVEREYLKVASKFELAKFFFSYIILNKYFLIVVFCVIAGMFFGYIFNSASLTRSTYVQYVDELKQKGKYAEENKNENVSIKDFYSVMKNIEEWMQKDVENEAKSRGN